ncbi:6149_t:CDS:2 [Dentiscutata heterogama]|uniref:6149_t:CDS:1 n=1 Tax=Dentiscutata heterogama TaxID=1316150 RepID=A0ACA9MJS0_9GLOM|nr:6149_t:CDS:2 [Dentiscutata heterogama]
MTESNKISNWNEKYNELLDLFKVPPLKPELQLTDEELSNTLEIPLLDGSYVILIAARRVEIEPGCQITVNYKKSFRIVIYTEEITSELEIIAKNHLKVDDSSKFIINKAKNDKCVGKLLTIRDGKNPEYKDIYIFDNTILKNHSFLKILRYSVLIASVLFYDKPEITRSILSWICKINESYFDTKQLETKELSKLKELYYQALSMLVQLDIFKERENNEISFVPLLNKQFYKDGIKEFMESIKYYEDKYVQFLNKSEDIDRKKIESKVLLENSNDNTSLYNHLKNIEYERYDSASKLVKKIEEELEVKKNNVDSACKHFKEELEKWKNQKIHEAQLHMVIAVFDLAVRIGTIVIRPDGIVSIIETIKETSISVQDALDAGDKVKAFIEENNDIGDKIQRIKEIGEDLEKNYADAKDLNEVITKQKRVESLDVNELAQILKTEDRKGIKMKAEWKSIENFMLQLLEPFEKEIEGVPEYKNSLKDLFNYINAYIEANNEEAKSFKEYSRIKLQIQVFERKEERLKERIEDYKSEEDYYNDCAFSLIECFINIKSCMLKYLEIYEYAYKYWSLSKSEVKLSVMKTTAKHMEDYHKIYQELENSYYKFGGPPQTSEGHSHSIRIDGENYIKKFKSDRFITYEIPLNHPKFLRYERVRIINFGVFLDGVGSKDDEISLTIISNTNMFNDRYKGKTYYFRSGKRIVQEFRYQVPDKILTDVSFKSDVYFVPTPFSQWTIRLDNCKIGESILDPSEIDLSGLKSIEIKLDVEFYLIEK